MWWYFILTTLLTAGEAVAPKPTNPATPSDPTTLVAHCDGVAFSRADVMACMLDATDTNHDGRITPAEMQAAVDTYLWWYERWLVKLVGGVADVLRDCDTDGDGVVTYSDMLHSEVTCLPLTDADGNELDGMCKVKTYLCDRATAALQHHTYKK